MMDTPLDTPHEADSEAPLSEALPHARTRPPELGPPRVTLDQERCRGCLLCIGICPNDLFVRDDRPNASGALPARMRYPEYCINCMRCVSICPDQAFEVPSFPEFNLGGHVFGLSLRLHRLFNPDKRVDKKPGATGTQP